MNRKWRLGPSWAKCASVKVAALDYFVLTWPG
jgi:hypothetical protein